MSNIYTSLATKLANILLPYTDEKARDEHTLDRLKFSCEAVLRDVSKFALLALCTIPLGITKYVIVYAVGYAWLGRVAFGFHLDSPVLCTLSGLVYYLGSVYLSLKLAISLRVEVLVCVICGFILWSYAPAETRKRPISERKKKELKPKIIFRFLVLTCGTLLLQLLPNKTYSSLLLFSVVARTVNVLPFLNYNKGAKGERG